MTHSLKYSYTRKRSSYLISLGWNSRLSTYRTEALGVEINMCSHSCTYISSEKITKKAIRPTVNCVTTTYLPNKTAMERAQQIRPTPLPNQSPSRQFLGAHAGRILVWKYTTRPTRRRLHNTQPSSSSRAKPSVGRATVMVLVGHSSTGPGNDRWHGRIRCGPHLGHVTAFAAVIYLLGLET